LCPKRKKKWMQRGKVLGGRATDNSALHCRPLTFFSLTCNYFPAQNWYLTDLWPSLGKGSFQIDRKHQTQIVEFARFFDFVNNLQFQKNQCRRLFHLLKLPRKQTVEKIIILVQVSIILNISFWTLIFKTFFTVISSR
jgi:hypothetical protein